MYKDYYNLKEEPFSITPNPKFLFGITQYHDALAHIFYATKKNGIVLLTGEVGIGKTQIIKSFLEKSKKEKNLSVGDIIATNLSDEELLRLICESFKIKLLKKSLTKKELLDSLNKFLLKNQEENIDTILIVDEAQAFAREQLELLRYLSNLENNSQKLLKLVLAAQPEFNTILENPEILSFKQRIIEHIHLGNLNKSDSQNYIQHRLFVSGAKRLIFDNGALSYLADISRGIPRMINIYCDKLLLAGFVEKKFLIDKDFVKKVLAKKINIKINIKILSLILGFVFALSTIAGVSWWLLSKNNGNLMKKIGEIWKIENPICGQNFYCEEIENMSFQEIREFGFPFFIKIDKQKYLIRDTGSNLLYLEGEDGNEREVSLEDFLKTFKGSVEIAVPVPVDFKKEIKEGEQGEYVKWISNNLSKIYNNKKLYNNDYYNKNLIDYIIRFQKDNNLKESGKFGVKDYMKLLKYSSDVNNKE